MKIEVKSEANNLYVRITSSEPHDYPSGVYRKVYQAIMGAMPTAKMTFSNTVTHINPSYSDANFSLPEAGAEALARSLRLVNAPREVTYDALLDAISDASYACKDAAKAQMKK
jgi:hypothetical protein